MDRDQSDNNIFDAQGYRFNVGIVLLNERNQAFWGRRSGQDSWQFPQGGINAGESSEQAMWRELFEETGLRPADVTLLGETADWLYYRLPVRYRRKRRPGMVQCIGQKQKWFLLRLESGDPAVNLNASSQPPEFDDWCWIDYYAPPGEAQGVQTGAGRAGAPPAAGRVAQQAAAAHGATGDTQGGQASQGAIVCREVLGLEAPETGFFLYATFVTCYRPFDDVSG